MEKAKKQIGNPANSYLFTHMRTIILLISLSVATTLCFGQTQKIDYYLVKVYHCSHLEQVRQIEEYVGNTLIPFLKKNSIKHVGVFLPIANDTAVNKRLMVWAPLTNLSVLKQIETSFGGLDPYGDNPLIGLDSLNKKPPYTRLETMLAMAFRDHPTYAVKSSFEKSPENIYEFRSYESSTEALHLNKVHMFNQGGEINIFKNLDFNAIFYGRVIVGAHMPNLIYMTSFKNIQERNDRWNRFREDPSWKKLSKLPQYAGNVSRNETILLKPSRYNSL